MRRNRLSLLPALATATLLIGLSVLEPLARGKESLPRTDTAPELEQPDLGPLAGALRACDLETAQAAVAALGPDRDERGLILGLGAARCGQHAAGLNWLLATPPGSDLEDWRLFGIARTSIELGQYPAAKAALDTLRRAHPKSPLFASATLAAAEVARERGDLEGVVEISRRSTGWLLDREHAEGLDVAAWHASVELGDAGLRREAAARLLVEHPVIASKLKVIEDFRAEDGSIEWRDFLSTEEIVERADSLFQAGLHDSAMETLTLLEAVDRTVRWHLVSADALTSSGRGEEALKTLEALLPRNRLEELEVEWRRAFAALDASEPRSGRQLTSLQRRMMRERAHTHLERVIEIGLDPERSKRALRVLFENALDDDLFDDAMATLRRLKALDPEDRSGARHLWQYGWKQHQERNFSGAIGYWTELSALYPTSSYNRSGLYWSARAHEVLGNRPRSLELLNEVANVPFTDFYRRQALRRLGHTGESESGPAAPTEPWPQDPRLSRAERLLGWGLDSDALIEVSALAARSDPRATGALKSLILGELGERRRSIIEIKGVFSLLGTPFQGVAPNRARLLYYPLAFDRIVEQNAERNGLDRNLILAMIRQESAFDPQARSWAGASGLMQVMPATGREIAQRLGLSYNRERLSDPAFSIRLGTTYYKQVRSMFGENDELALAGYNAGPYRIKRLWRQAGENAEFDRFLEGLELEETRWYVKRVLLFADSYRRLYPGESPPPGAELQPAAG